MGIVRITLTSLGEEGNVLMPQFREVWCEDDVMERPEVVPATNERIAPMTLRERTIFQLLCLLIEVRVRLGIMICDGWRTTEDW